MKLTTDIKKILIQVFYVGLQRYLKNISRMFRQKKYLLIIKQMQ